MKVWLKRLLKLFLILLLLFVCAWWFENWRGARTWEKTQERLAVADISLDMESYQPAPVPAEENLLENPVFKIEWNREIHPPLRALEKMEISGTVASPPTRSINPALGNSLTFDIFYEDAISEEEASKRLFDSATELRHRVDSLVEIILSYPTHLQGRFAPTGEEPILPPNQILSLQGISRCLQDLAVLDLRNNEAQKALHKLQALNHLSITYSGPAAIHQLVEMAMHKTANQIIWEGLRLRSWNEEHLQILATFTTRASNTHSLDQAVKMELAYNHFLIDHPKELFAFEDQLRGEPRTESLAQKISNYYHTGGPEGWTGQRKATSANLVLRHLENPDRWSSPYDSPSNLPGENSPFYLGGSIDQTFQILNRGFLDLLTSSRIAHLAILLELDFLKQGRYPNSLSELKGGPEFIDATDPKKRPFTYQLSAEGRPMISSLHEAESKRRNSRLGWQYHSK